MRKKLIEILCRIDARIADDLDMDLLSSGIIDSFEIVNLVVDLEEAFDMEIDPELVTPDNFRTANMILKLVEGIVDQ